MDNNPTTTAQPSSLCVTDGLLTELLWTRTDRGRIAAPLLLVELLSGFWKFRFVASRRSGKEAREWAAEQTVELDWTGRGTRSASGSVFCLSVVAAADRGHK